MSDENANLFSMPILPDDVDPNVRTYLEELSRLLSRLMTGDQYRDGALHINKVTSLAAPINGKDAVNKDYVDEFACPEIVAALPSPSSRDEGHIVYRTTDCNLFVRIN